MCLAIPGRIEALYTRSDGAPMARADFAGEMRDICLAYMPQLTVGDYTIVHAGFALSLVSEEEAQTIIATMRETEILPPASPHRGVDAPAALSMHDMHSSADLSQESVTAPSTYPNAESSLPSRFC